MTFYNSNNNFNNFVSNSNINVEKILFANITIYNNINARIKFANVIENYLKLWNDNEFIVRISFEKWMLIELKFDAKIETTKIYFSNFSNRKLIDEIFDKLHVQNRMKYINQFISHDYFVFVV